MVFGSLNTDRQDIQTARQLLPTNFNAVKQNSNPDLQDFGTKFSIIESEKAKSQGGELHINET